jgi:DNA-binding IscR family transcriptional regulator
LLESVRGPRGGYRLGRARRDIRMADIAAVAIEADAADGPGGALQAAVVERMWSDLDARIDETLRSITLEDLLRRAAEAGLRRPATEPISFAI